MTTEHEPLDMPDTDLQALFASVQPSAGFEDRLVAIVRQQRRLRLPTLPAAVRKAAIAAAAVLAVGTTGYFGNRVMLGNLHPLRTALSDDRFAPEQNSGNTESDTLIRGLNDPARESESASRFKPRSITQTMAGDNTMFRDANGNVMASTPASRTLDWISNVGNAAVPGSIAANPADAPHNKTQSRQTRFSDGPEGQALVPRPIGEVEKSEGEKRQLSASSASNTSTNHSEPRAWPTQNSVAHEGYKVAGDGHLLEGSEQFADGEVKGLNYFHGVTREITSPPSTPEAQAPAFAYTTLTPPNNGGKDQLLTNLPLSPGGDGLVPKINGDSLKVLGQDASRDGAEQFYIGGHVVSSGTAIRSTPPSGSPRDNLDSVLLPPANTDADPAVNKPSADLKSESPASPAKEGRKAKNPTDTSAIAADINPSAPPATADKTGQNLTPVAATAPAVDDRKIIRTGTMEFDVDRFDTAQMQITKIVGELGGFVGATDSQKLPNGKVRGSISVRVAPERLDTLVLSLRALGDLKSQQITASDITKEYTDIQSELAADRAMQDRLLQLIHDGKGTVKDLLAAENELGEWRTKIEKAEGMIRYYNGQVALSTLTITLSERDIQTPATAVETETADVGIEADDVEKARNSALKAIDDVKGRIVEAELKRFDAGQLAARLVADVPPESAGAVIDQLKQLGKVARLEVHRQQASSDGSAAVTNTTPLKTERKPTRLLISIYNLANVAPRRTTNVSLAANDVETAYAALVSVAKSSGGRVVTSALDRGDPIKATASLVLELPPDKFDDAIKTLHAQGDVLNLNLTENPDTQNSTEAKAGLTIKLISLANVAPRHSTSVVLAADDVDAAYTALAAVAKSSGGRVVTSALDRGDPGKATGSLVLEFPPDKMDAVLTTLHAQGDVLKSNLSENTDTQNSTELKQGLVVRLIAMATVEAREKIEQTLATNDVPAAYQAILTAAGASHCRVVTSALDEKDRQNITGEILLDVPRASAAELDKAISDAGGTIGRTSSRSADAENTVDSKMQLKLLITSADHLPPRETTRLQVEVGDVDKSSGDVQAAAIAVGGRVVEANINRDQGKGIARVILDFPLAKSGEVLQAVRSQGTVRGIDASRDQAAPAGPMAHGQIYVEFRTADAIVADNSGPWASIREGLSTSISGLLWSLKLLVMGLCFLGPWVGLGWIGWKLSARFRKAKVAAVNQG